MADSITVPELPALNRASGDELIAVWKDDRLVRLPQASLRGSQTFSGDADPPLDVAAIMALDPVLGDRWRNRQTGDEWKVTALEPFTWAFDGNVKGADGVGLPGPPGVGKVGPAGPSGRVETRVAGAAISNWTAVIIGTDDRFYPADCNTPAHRQRVVGIVATGGTFGASLTAQTAGDVKGPDGNFVTGTTLFVGPNGALISAAPASGWRQPVAAVVSTSQLNVALGEARVVADEGVALILPGGGFAGPCPIDGAARADADGYVTPAANTRAFRAALAGVVPPDLPPRRGQFLRALEAMQPGSIDTLFNAVPTDLSDPINTAWFHTIGVTSSGRLAQFAKTQLGLTDAQIAAAIASARLISE